MQIQASIPFAISKDSDGVQHAVRSDLALSITPDINAKINHRYGTQPELGNATRWLHVQLPDENLHLFIDGKHVLITREDYFPSFDILNEDQFIARAMKYMKIEKDERGRYVMNTDQNRKVLKELFRQVELQQKNRLLAWIRNLVGRICD